MQRCDDRLRGVGTDIPQDGVHTFSAASELPEWVIDPRRPVDAGDDFAAWSASGAEAIAVNAEGEFGDPRDAARFTQASIVSERLGITAHLLHEAIKVVLADDTEFGNPHWFSMLSDRRQQLADVAGVGFVNAEKVMQGDVRSAGLGQYRLLLRGPGHATKLGDEFPDGDIPSIGDVGGHVAAEAALVVPVR